MGEFFYQNQAFAVDDEALQLIQIVVADKVRRGEATLLNLLRGQNRRDTFWIGHHIPMGFRFSGARRIAVDSKLLDAMKDAANSNQGIVVKVAGA